MVTLVLIFCLGQKRPMHRAPARLRGTVRIDGLHGGRSVRRRRVPANPSRLAASQVAVRDRPSTRTSLTTPVGLALISSTTVPCAMHLALPSFGRFTSQQLHRRAAKYRRMAITVCGQDTIRALKRLAVRFALLAAKREIEEGVLSNEAEGQ